MSKIEDRESFTYKYSAKQREEIYQIRKKYESPAEDKLERLRHLDSLTVKKASIHALTLGIIGVLVLGTGMSFTMTNLYELLGLSYMMSMILGISMGIVGIGLVCFAYPLYFHVLVKERKRIASDIIKLADELMKS